MGLFDFLKSKSGSGQFVSATSYKVNLDKQIEMTPQTLSQLRQLNVHASKELRLEYFFYTDTAGKAGQLANELGKLNYSVQFRISAGDTRLFLITGWTTKMKMADDTVKEWVNHMCVLGYKFDCEFDGWGTDPNQE